MVTLYRCKLVYSYLNNYSPVINDNYRINCYLRPPINYKY